MGETGIRVVAGVLGLGVTAALAVAVQAGAASVTGESIPVAGKQTPVAGKEDTLEMSGGLVGTWKITSFKQTATKPVFKARGTESFKGCLDRKLDGSCSGDPTGTLNFSFRYWGVFDSRDHVVLGTCAHPVTGGSGDFAGAGGFLMMVDTPKRKAPFTETHWEGTIVLAGAPARRLMSSGCG